MSAANWEDTYDAIAKAKAAGFEIVYSDEKTLLLDLDTHAQVAQFNEIYGLFKKLFPVKGVDKWKSKSGHTHVKVTLDVQLPIEIRVALQAALGSDPKREILTILNILTPPNPIVLFAPAVNLGTDIIRD